MPTDARRMLMFAGALCAIAAIFTIPVAAQVNSASKKYTTTPDFNLGASFNVDTSGDQVDLADVVTTFPVMWISNAGEDTVSRIDTTTGKEVGRYRIWFTGSSAAYPTHLGNPYAGAAPSRTAVDQVGNVYVGNRHFDGRAPVLLKILSSGFIDRNGNGLEDTSTDVNMNGKIDPATEMLPLVDTNANQIIDQSEIQDERVAWATRLPSPVENNGLGRSVSIDTAGNVWFGSHSTRRYYKIRGTDGVILSGPHATNTAGDHTPYGSLIDGNNILWSASLQDNLVKLDTTDPDNAAKKARYVHGGTNYGIASGLQGAVPHIYLGIISGGRYVDFNTSTNTFSFPACGGFVFSIGVATDGAGNIFIGHNNGIRKCSPTGALLWDAGLQPGTFEGWGVVIDSDQNAWLIHRANGVPGPGKIAKYNGATGAAMGVFDVGANPYTYSDATGIGIFQAQRQGNWRVSQTASLPNNVWRATWNTEPQGAVPPGTSLLVEARTASTQAGLAAQPFSAIPNGGGSCVAGAFIEVRATLSSTVPATPVLSDLSLMGKCDINGDGKVSRTDINEINAARNTPSGGMCDFRDADGNGTINVNDARQCSVRCTNANCAN